MKTFLTIVLLCIAYISINAQSLGIIESENSNDIYELFNQQDISIHFYNDDFAIISGDYKNDLRYSLLVVRPENFINNSGSLSYAALAM